MSCGITDPLSCVGRLASGGVTSAWDAICASFATAADALLKAFARAFTAIPPVDLATPAVKNVYAICLGIAAAIAAVLLLGQVIRTAISRDGSPLAEGLTGIGKAAIAFMLTLVITSAAVTAADSLTTYIINRSFGSAAGLTAHLATLHPSRYGALVDGVSAVHLTGVRVATDQSVALRLVVLADRLYDRQIPVIASGARLDEIFDGDMLVGGYRKKYRRAISRLVALNRLGVGDG